MMRGDTCNGGIARACSLSAGPVNQLQRCAVRAGLANPLPAALDAEGLHERICGHPFSGDGKYLTEAPSTRSLGIISVAALGLFAIDRNIDRVHSNTQARPRAWYQSERLGYLAAAVPLARRRTPHRELADSSPT